MEWLNNSLVHHSGNKSRGSKINTVWQRKKALLTCWICRSDWDSWTDGWPGWDDE